MKKNTLATALAALLALCGWVDAGDIRNTRHNLSITGPGEIKSSAEDRICIFCHTPHKSREDVAYLWNRSDVTAHYTIYQSSTMKSPNPGQPTGASKLCLSCHDGTIALGAVRSRTQEIPFTGGIRFMPGGRRSLLDTDLSDDHPVSLNYESAYTNSGGELRPSNVFPPNVSLDSSGRLQCTACHDPHDDTFGNFLVMSNRYSNLCTVCHDQPDWETSSHATDSANWNNSGPDPWPETDFQTVAENGCGNCHTPHAADGRERLLKYRFEEDNCLVCHNGNVAATDIGRQITKTYGHKVQRYTDVHDPLEDFNLGAVPEHVECADCHNPHQAGGGPMGSLTGVQGINGPLTGNRTEELCFKCHSGFNNVTDDLPVTRELYQTDKQKQFDPSNPSFHPVGSPGVNPDVPSLKAPYTVNSVITCQDCHGSNEAGAPAGPHGSSYRFILNKNYNINDNTSENTFNYELCYSCHSRENLFNKESGSWKDHKKHVVDKKTPCSVCHDPHGISSDQGNPVNNSHLLNFDLTAVFPDTQGRLYFEDLGRFKGRCYMTCHNKEHKGLGY